VDLKATTQKTFFEVLDPRLIANWNKTENLLTLINGHEIYFWGLDDIEKLKSLEIGWFWIDEVNEIDQNKFDILRGRLRHKAQPKRVGFVTSNSEGRNWTFKVFVMGEGLRSKQDHEKFLTIKAPSDENTNLPEDYLEVLNSYTGDLYERYVRASFSVFEGQIFPDFKREINVIKPFAIPENWTKIGGIDHGERNPTAFLWCAISPRGDLVFYRDYSVSGLFVDKHAENVYKLNNGERLEKVFIDPSVKSVRGGSGKKVDSEWKENWLKLFGELMPMRYANNDVSAGIARIHKYLRLDPDRKHLVTGKKGAPRVYIFDTCVTLIDQTEGYKWKKISPTSENDPDEKPRKRDDHEVDVFRYIIMSRPDIDTCGFSTKSAILLNKLKGREEQLISLTDDKYLENIKSLYPEDFISLP